MRILSFIALAIFSALLSACADRFATADRLAASAKLVRFEIQTEWFRLTAFSRITDPAAPAVIYIEGDGFAWASRTEPSTDPTPRDPVGLRLATEDQSANVIYLARPCQYSRGDAVCEAGYWTGRRFAEEVVSSMDEAVSQATKNLRVRRLHLVGYSGGGGVAALIAARRSDVASLRTVAGNLDHRLFTNLHRVSDMVGSLNPADVAPRLALIPQEHFVSESDGIVPVAVAESFVRAMGDSRCVAVTRVPHTSHQEGWVPVWSGLAERLPSCRK